MRWNLLLIVGLFLVMGTFVSAAPTVGAPVLTYNSVANPTHINPSAAFPLSVQFTVTDPDYLAGQTAQIEVVLSVDTSVGGDDIIATIDLNQTLPANVSCAGDVNTGITCTATWNGPATIADGAVYGVVKATINALTDETESAATILDKGVPSFTTNPTLTNADASVHTTWVNQDVNLTSACDGTGSTCTLYYKLGGGSYTEFTSPYQFTSGSGDLLVKVVDQALNETVFGTTLNLKIDKVAPAFSSNELSVPSEINVVTPTFTFSASDAGSGLDTITIRCEGGTDLNFAYSTTITTFDITGQGGCPSGEGEKDLEIRVYDALDNVSAIVNKTILYDNTDPTDVEKGDISSSSVTESSLSLEWPDSSDPAPSSGISEYEVYRSKEDSSFGNATLIGSPSSSSYSDSGLESCKKYYYWVKAVDDAGNTSSVNNGFDVTTTGCASSSSGDDGSSSSGGGGGGGGGGGAACSVTFDISPSVYAGESINAKVSGNNYVNGHFRVTPAGKPTVTIQKTGASSNMWSGNYAIPTQVGLSLKFVFGTDGCTASTTRIVKDPSTKPAATPVATQTETESGESETTLKEEVVVLPEPFSIVFDLAKLSEVLANAGFNAENAQMRSDIESTLSKWNVVRQVKMMQVEGTDEYVLQLVLTLANTSNSGTIKIIEDVPKAFASLSTEFEANYPMTVLKEDPLIQFEIPNLIEGQALEIILTGKESHSFEEAQEKLETLKTDAIAPPLLFASGNAQRAPGSEGDGLSVITGFVGFIGSNGLIILGFLAVVGIIMVSVRTIRSSVPGETDNPILRSSAGVKGNRSDARMPRTPVRGQKMWKSGEVRLGDDDY